MKRVIPAILAVLTPLLYGCAATGPAPEEGPAWVLDPESALAMPGFLAAAGVGRAESAAAALERARAAGRRELAGKISEYVSGSVTRFFETKPEHHPGRDAGILRFTEVLAAEVGSQILRRPLEKQAWVPDDGDTAYVLVRIPLPAVNSATFETAMALDRDFMLFAKGREETVFTELYRDMNLAFHGGLKEAAADGPETGVVEYPMAPKPPQWLITGRSERFPSGLYILAVGIGDSVAGAETSARREALMRLTALSRAAAVEAGANPEKKPVCPGENINYMPPALISAFPGDDFGVWIEELWYDPAIDVHYALAVIDRDSAARRSMDSAVLKAEDWEHLLGSARNQMRAGNFRRACEDMLRAAARGESALQRCLNAAALLPEDAAFEPEYCMEVLKRVSIAETYDALNELLREFRIIPLEGPGDWIAAGSGKQRPLSVMVVAGPESLPVAGVQVKFELRGMTGRFDVSGDRSIVVKSGADGVAGAVVRPGDFRRAESAVIKVSLALDDMLKGEKIYGRLNPPMMDFRYVRHERRGLSVGVGLKESGPWHPEAKTGAVQDRLIEILGREGFIPLDEEKAEISLAELAGLEGEELVAGINEVASRVEGMEPVIFVTGVSGSEITDRRETSLGTLHFAVCRVRVHLTRLCGGAVGVAILEVEGLAAAAGAEDAALRDAGEDAAVRLGEKIVSVLMPG